MASRYYFLSSLPMISFSLSSPMTWESFLYQAKGNVSDSDYALLVSLEDSEAEGCAFLKSYKAFCTSLDGAINEKRNVSLGRSAKSALDSSDYEIQKTCKAVFEAKDPLEAELLIMKSRFEYLDSLKGFENFSRSALLCYALQLRILIRKDLFTKENGNSEYQRLFSELQKQMKME